MEVGKCKKLASALARFDNQAEVEVIAVCLPGLLNDFLIRKLMDFHYRERG